MDNPPGHQTDIQELEPEKLPGFSDAGQTDAETSMPIKDADTTLSIIVLLLACLGLAALAQVIVS